MTEHHSFRVLRCEVFVAALQMAHGVSQLIKNGLQMTWSMSLSLPEASDEQHAHLTCRMAKIFIVSASPPAEG